MAIGPAGSSRTQSDRRRLGSVTLARSRVRVRVGYEFVSCRRHGDQRLPAGPIATSHFITFTFPVYWGAHEISSLLLCIRCIIA